MHAVYFLLTLVVDWDIVPAVAHAVRQKTAQLRGRRRGQYGYQHLPDGDGRWTEAYQPCSQPLWTALTVVDLRPYAQATCYMSCFYCSVAALEGMLHSWLSCLASCAAGQMQL
jgi:hypothetical protein